MKFKLTAGADVDILTRQELGEELDRSAGAWRTELSRNVKFPRFSAQAIVAGGVWSIDPSQTSVGKLGPRPGFLWSIMRLAVTGGGIVVGTDVWRVFLNEASSSQFVDSSLRGMRFDAGALVLRDGDNLFINGVGTGGATDVTVTGRFPGLAAAVSHGRSRVPPKDRRRQHGKQDRVWRLGNHIHPCRSPQ
jgi:hypothetical protein